MDEKSFQEWGEWLSSYTREVQGESLRILYWTRESQYEAMLLGDHAWAELMSEGAAGIAQTVEQMNRNHQVAGSTPAAGKGKG